MILLNFTVKGKQEDSIQMKTITVFFFNITLLGGGNSPLASSPVSDGRGCHQQHASPPCSTASSVCI